VKRRRPSAARRTWEGKLNRVRPAGKCERRSRQGPEEGRGGFQAIKDLSKWIGDQFTSLETLRDQILQALTDKDPQRYKWRSTCSTGNSCPSLPALFRRALLRHKESPINVGCKPGGLASVTHPRGYPQGPDLLRLEVHARQEAELQTQTDALDAVTRNLEFIKSQIPTRSGDAESRLGSMRHAPRPAAAKENRRCLSI